MRSFRAWQQRLQQASERAARRTKQKLEAAGDWQQCKVRNQKSINKSHQQKEANRHRTVQTKRTKQRHKQANKRQTEEEESIGKLLPLSRHFFDIIVATVSTLIPFISFVGLVRSS